MARKPMPSHSSAKGSQLIPGTARAPLIIGESRLARAGLRPEARPSATPGITANK